MINEANFNDIRRNFIMSSVIYILFLIYGSHIKLKNFFFEFTGDWYVISVFWDIFTLLSLLFLYTLGRYIVYGIDNINDNGYSNLKLYSILEAILDKEYIDIMKSYVINGKEKYLFSKIRPDTVKINSEERASLRIGIISSGERGGHIIKPLLKDIKKIKFLKDSIGFNYNNFYVYIKFNSIEKFNNIIKSIPIVFLRKEFSDFLWPLSLLLIIIGLLDFRFFYFLGSLFN